MSFGPCAAEVKAFRVKLKWCWILGKLVFRSELHRSELFPFHITITLSSPYLK